MISKWAIGDLTTKDITGGILQNDVAPTVQAGMVAIEVPVPLRDIQPIDLKLDVTGTTVEMKSAVTLLAQAKTQVIADTNNYVNSYIYRAYPQWQQAGFSTRYASLAAVANEWIDSCVVVSNDTHTVNINALADIASVEAYDFTTGYPALP